jgi:Flp pilus assembly pilin Flp
MSERLTIRFWRLFRRQDSGQDLLEYALLAALIALVAVSAVTEVGSAISGVLWEAIDATTNSI